VHKYDRIDRRHGDGPRGPIGIWSGSIFGLEGYRHLSIWNFNNQRAVRQGDWKLILNPPSYPGDEIADKVWLSNLESERGERTNLAN